MELWLVVGREMHQNKLKHVCLLSNTGKRKMMTVNQLSTFSNKNKVVNVKAYGEQLQGVGISLLSIPTYKKDPTGQMVQISGTSEQSIISAAQPFINKIMEEEQRKEARKNAPDVDKESKINFIIDKLQLCYNILNELENTKSLTNEKLLIERVSRYTKQLDIDNADDSIQNNVTRYGITGLVKSVDTRISRCKERAKKYNLLKENIRERTGFDTIQSLCEMMFQKVENVKKQHKITYDLIKEGKGRQVEAEEESIPKAFEFKKEQMAKVDHYVGEFKNTNNYFSEDRFKQILKDYKQYLVDIVNNNKIDSSWTYVKCRTSEGRNVRIIDLDASINDIRAEFNKQINKYVKQQEADNQKSAKEAIKHQEEEEKRVAEEVEKMAKQEEEAAMSQAEMDERDRLGRTVCNVIAYKFKERTTLLEPGRYSYYQLIPLNILMLIGTQLMHDPEYNRDYMNNVYCPYGSILGDNGRFGSDNFKMDNYVFIGTKRYTNITNGMRTDEMGRKVAEQVLLDVFLYGEHKKLVTKQFHKIARSAVGIYNHSDIMNGLEVCDVWMMGDECKGGLKEQNKKLIDMIVDTCASIQNRVVKEVKK